MELIIDRCNWTPLEGYIVYNMEGVSSHYFDMMRKTIVTPKNHFPHLEVCEYGARNSIYKPIVATIPPLELPNIPYLEDLLKQKKP